MWSIIKVWSALEYFTAAIQISYYPPSAAVDRPGQKHEKLLKVGDWWSPGSEVPVLAISLS